MLSKRFLGKKKFPLIMTAYWAEIAISQFSDWSHKDEEVLLLISDYVHLIWESIKKAKDSGVSDEATDNLMNQQTIYHGQHLKPRKYKEIVEDRFDVSEIFRIEKQTNQDTIADKTFDFSSGTIQHLLNEGY